MDSSYSKQINITLQPEQQKVLAMPPQGAVQIKGVAGSGKTTVAIHRAKYLIDTYPSMFSRSSVAIFTFNRLLANYMQELVGEVITSANVKVLNFHRWAYAFIETHRPGACGNTVDGYKRDRIIAEVRGSKKLSVCEKSVAFLGDEIRWMKGKYFKTMSEYVDAERKGRGNDDRLSRKQKEEMWEVYEAYNLNLSAHSLVDFDDYAILAYEIIHATKGFAPPFSHIVIDEAQDLNKIQLLTLKELVSEDTNSITIIADNAQRIYKSGFNWSEIGFDFKGKTRVLRKNYRSTIQISKAAQSLLLNESQDNDFTRIESARRGEYLPKVKKLACLADQVEYAVAELKDRAGETAVFLHRSRSGVEDVSIILSRLGIDHDVISSGDKVVGAKGVKVCTLSSIKGLEFDHVFIMDCSAEYIPSFNDTDEDDLLHVSTERRLLYTAMTRARERLFILYSGKESMFLNEISASLIDAELDNE